MKKTVFLLVFFALCAALQAQTVNIRRSDCRKLEVRDLSHRLVERTNSFESAQFTVVPGMGALIIYFNDGSDPVIFAIDGSSAGSLPDGSRIYYEADRLDPETMDPVESGFSVAIARRNRELLFLVQKGTVTHVALLVSSGN
jgi:hypothetical protein